MCPSTTTSNAGSTACPLYVKEVSLNLMFSGFNVAFVIVAVFVRIAVLVGFVKLLVLLRVAVAVSVVPLIE